MALQLRRGETRSFGKMIITSFAVMAFVLQPLVSLNIPAAFAVANVGKTIVARSYIANNDHCNIAETSPICMTIEDAVAIADTGDTISLNGNFSPAKEIVIKKAITIEGNNVKVWGEFNTNGSNNSVFELQAPATLQNLRLDGKSHNVHGINAWHTNGDATVWNVTLQKFGKSGLNVGEGARVVAGNLTTSQNGWDAIDVDKTGSWLKLAGTNHFNENAGVPVVYVDNVNVPNGINIDLPDLYSTRDNYKLNGDRAYFVKTASVTNMSAKFQSDTKNLTNGQWLNITNKAAGTNNLVLNFDAPSNTNVQRYITTESRPDGTSENISNKYHNTWLNRGNPPIGVADSRAEFGLHGDGLYTYSVVAISADNGTKSDPVTYSLNYDRTNPTVTFTNPTKYVNTTKPFTISGTYSDVNSQGRAQSGVGRLHLYVSANGHDLSDPFIVSGSQLNQTTGTFSYTLTQADLDKLASQLNLKNNDTFVVKANVFDNANNWANFTTDFVVDTVAPDFTVQSFTGNKTSNTFSKVSFNLHDTHYVTKWVLNEGTANEYSKDVAHAIYTGDSNFQNMKSHLVQGVNTLTAYDKAGNSATYTFTFDSVTPTLPVLDTALNGAYFNTTPIKNTWSTATDENGTGVAGYQVAYSYGDGHSFGSNADWTTVTINGRTQLTRYTTNLITSTFRNHNPGANEQGPVTVWVRSIDFAGNVSDWSTSATYTFDSIAPVVTIDSPEANKTVKGAIDIVATIEDKNLSHYYLVVKTRANSSQAWTTLYKDTIHTDEFSNRTLFTVPNTVTGEVVVLLEAKDMANNKDDIKSVKKMFFNIDNTVPTVSLTGIPTTPTNVTPVIATLTFSEPVTGVDSSWTRDTTNPLVYTKTFAASATEIVNFQDVAGNTGSVEVAVAIDTTAPALVVNTYTGTDTTPTITGTTENKDDLVTVNGGAATVSQTQNTDGTYSWTYTFKTPFVIGSTRVVVMSTDTAGNFTRNNATVTVVDPNLTLDQTDAPTVNFTPSADQTTGQQEVQGDATSKTPQVEGANTSKSDSDNASSTNGFAWYWWLLIPAVLLTLWGLIAAARRRNNEA